MSALVEGHEEPVYDPGEVGARRWRVEGDVALDVDGDHVGGAQLAGQRAGTVCFRPPS
jgi:hypothetical protein